MAKAKLKFKAADANKLKVAAHFTGVELGKGIKLGENLIVETKWKDAQQLVEMVSLIPQVSGNEQTEEETPANTTPAKGGKK